MTIRGPRSLHDEDVLGVRKVVAQQGEHAAVRNLRMGARGAASVRTGRLVGATAAQAPGRKRVGAAPAPAACLRAASQCTKAHSAALFSARTSLLPASDDPSTVTTRQMRVPPARWMHLASPGDVGSASSWRLRPSSALGMHSCLSSQKSRKKHCSAEK